MTLSDWNLISLPRIAHSRCHCPNSNDSRGNPAIVPAAIHKNRFNEVPSATAAKKPAIELLMLVGEHGSDLMVPRIAMMKALQREATAASARAGNAPRPTSSFADASCSASLASAPDVRSAGVHRLHQTNAPRRRSDDPVALMRLILRRVWQRTFVIFNPYVVPRVDPAVARLASKKNSTSQTRRLSARSSSTVPRGLDSSSDRRLGWVH
jgi:hypothetical protein